MKTSERPATAFSNGQIVCPLGQGTWKIGQSAARRHNASPAQIALAWTIRKPGIIAIPKAGNIAHVEDNFRSLSIDLTEEDLHDLDTVFPAPIRKIPLAGW